MNGVNLIERRNVVQLARCRHTVAAGKWGCGGGDGEERTDYNVTRQVYPLSTLVIRDSILQSPIL